MKIVHVCLCSNVFGENYAYQDNLLPKFHKKLGHEVTIIAPNYSGFDKITGMVVEVAPLTKILGNGIKLVRLKAVLSCKYNQHFHIFAGFYDALEAENPNLIFVHGMGSYSYMVLPRFKKKHPEVKIVFDNHADKINSWHNRLSLLETKTLTRLFVARKNIKVGDWFYGVTPARCSVLNEIYGVPQQKIKFLPMGADDDDMHFDEKEVIRKEIRKEYGVSVDDFLVVTGGKIDRLKNIHVLVKALLSIDNPHLKILIFGNIVADMKLEYESLIHDPRVIYIGWINSNEVYRYFYAADLVMFPGLHSVLWEQAVASRVPCAFSKMEGFEHVDIGGNCILMDGKDESYYRDILFKLIEERASIENLWQNAQKVDADMFKYSKIAQQVINDLQIDNKII